MAVEPTDGGARTLGRRRVLGQLAAAAAGGAGLSVAATALDPDAAFGAQTNQSVAAASAGVSINIAAPPAMLDAYSLQASDRVLLKDQANASQNGIWVFNSAGMALTRPSDFSSGSGNVAGTSVAVQNGSKNGGTVWVLTGRTVTVDSTAETWMVGNAWGYVNVQMAPQVVGDGVTNDTSAITNLIATAEKLLPGGYLPGRHAQHPLDRREPRVVPGERCRHQANGHQ